MDGVKDLGICYFYLYKGGITTEDTDDKGVDYGPINPTVTNIVRSSTKPGK